MECIYLATAHFGSNASEASKSVFKNGIDNGWLSGSETTGRQYYSKIIWTIKTPKMACFLYAEEAGTAW
jgi:hypothetical protein